MPKILENVREQLLIEARRQIAEYGYKNTTIRSVAEACGCGVGTVYNYFESKDMLIATFVLEDWQNYLKLMEGLSGEEPEKLLRGIYESICSFAEDNRILFSDEDAARHIEPRFSMRYKKLRRQIAAFIQPICDGNGLCDGNGVCEAEFTAEFIAEALLCWSMEKVGFEAIYPILDRIINK